MAFSRSWRIRSSSFSKSTSRKNPAAGQREHHQRHQSSTNEPTSPRVSCMGRIKRCKTPPPPPRRGFDFFPKKTCSSSSRDCFLETGKSKRGLTVEEMDPPLPVEKTKEKPCFVESLWRRRCRDRADLAELKLCPPARLPGIEWAANYGVVA